MINMTLCLYQSSNVCTRLGDRCTKATGNIYTRIICTSIEAKQITKQLNEIN